MKIITIIGARPQFVKAAMLSHAIRRHNELHPEQPVQELLLHTGQHYDYEMSDVFFGELDIPAPRWNLGCTGSKEEMCAAIRPILRRERPNYVVVYGDTNSTAAGAMAAHEEQIPLVHIEAGLRSRNMEMPEERNRILTDRLSDLLFCPTPTAVANLRQEGIDQGVYEVGDIMYDTAQRFGNTGTAVLDEIGIQSKQYYLATIHRAENTDKPERLLHILQALARIDYPIVWPLHPRTRKTIESNETLLQTLKACRNLQLISGQSYSRMATLEHHAALILTDSGGVQKEAYFHRVPCVTLRDETEWIETVQAGWNQVVGTRSDNILAAVARATTPDTVITEYGDGHTAEKILDTLCASYY